MRNFVRTHQYVRSPLGRIRHLDTIRAWDRKVRSLAERQAINSPIQSTLSDMMLWAIAEIEEQLPEDKFAVVGMIHDALMAYADADQVGVYAPQAAAIMAGLPLGELGWNPPLSFPAEIEYGPDLAHLQPMALAA